MVDQNGSFAPLTQPTNLSSAGLQFPTMDTATAATSAASGARGSNGSRAADRLRELAAHLNLHTGFSDVVASLEAGHGGASAEQSFEEFVARDAKMGCYVPQYPSECADAKRVVPRHGYLMLSILIGR
jgi:hypothetical protein